jgi:hypothetical protein
MSFIEVSEATLTEMRVNHAADRCYLKLWYVMPTGLQRRSVMKFDKHLSLRDAIAKLRQYADILERDIEENEYTEPVDEEDEEE